MKSWVYTPLVLVHICPLITIAIDLTQYYVTLSLVITVVIQHRPT